MDEDYLWQMENFKNAYLNWLVLTMDAEEFRILLEYLYDCEFVCIVEEDSRRETGGRYLRERFESESGLELPKNGIFWPASFLEVLVSMAYSLETILHDPSRGTSPAIWFHEMLYNSGLSIFSDDYVLEHTGYGYGRRDSATEIAEAVDRVLLRRYSKSGRGSLFPPLKTDVDVRQMSLWDQLLAFANVILNE